jgi:hypothetical protein
LPQSDHSSIAVSLFSPLLGHYLGFRGTVADPRSREKGNWVPDSTYLSLSRVCLVFCILARSLLRLYRHPSLGSFSKPSGFLTVSQPPLPWRAPARLEHHKSLCGLGTLESIRRRIAGAMPHFAHKLRRCSDWVARGEHGKNWCPVSRSSPSIS